MERPTRVQLFATCLVDQFCPQAGDATVAILERLGLAVVVPPDQTCCGQPAFNGGFRDEAAAMARYTIDVLSACPDPVVVPSGSCADMMINRYPELFAADGVYGPKARELAARTFELTQFLVDVMGVEDTGAHWQGSVAYHASCHGLRGLGLKTQPRQLLAHVAGAQVADLPDAETCCGFGGLFAVKMPELSGAMLASKLDAITRSGADTIVATDVSCLMHIGGGLSRAGSPVRVRHIAEVLAGDGSHS
jgi:L-lactate dehydrogenase complex protein LldE